MWCKKVVSSLLHLLHGAARMRSDRTLSPAMGRLLCTRKARLWWRHRVVSFSLARGSHAIAYAMSVYVYYDMGSWGPSAHQMCIRTRRSLFAWHVMPSTLNKHLCTTVRMLKVVRSGYNFAGRQRLDMLAREPEHYVQKILMFATRLAVQDGRRVVEDVSGTSFQMSA